MGFLCTLSVEYDHLTSQYFTIDPTWLLLLRDVSLVLLSNAQLALPEMKLSILSKTEMGSEITQITHNISRDNLLRPSVGHSKLYQGLFKLYVSPVLGPSKLLKIFQRRILIKFFLERLIIYAIRGVINLQNVES